MTTTQDFLARIEHARGAARKLSIYRVPTGVMTMVAITPQTIETFPGVTVEEIADPALVSAALDAIAASRPEFEESPLDVRFALLFADDAGERILRVYKGSFASQGQIDDEPCAFDEPTLHAWLAARYGAR